MEQVSHKQKLSPTPPTRVDGELIDKMFLELLDRTVWQRSAQLLMKQANVFFLNYFTGWDFQLLKDVNNILEIQ